MTFSTTGPLAALTTAERARLCDRRTSTDAKIRKTTEAILERVRLGGDAALRTLARELDGVDLTALEVPDSFRNELLATIPAPLRAAMERAAANLSTVARAFAPRTGLPRRMNDALSDPNARPSLSRFAR